jgi:hypothetical protein
MVIVLETGVYFPMLDLDRPRTKSPVCFHTRAGFRRIARKRDVTQVKTGTCSEATEKLSSELPMSYMARQPCQMPTKANRDVLRPRVETTSDAGVGVWVRK